MFFLLPESLPLRSLSLEKAAFALSHRDRAEAAFLLQQVEGWQRLRTKVPAWAAIDALCYPPRISIEQCSGEKSARYKAEVVRALFPEGAGSMADLTGGLGIDFSFMAPAFRCATYVERDEGLCRLARHNFPLLGLPEVQVVHGDAVRYLEAMKPVDLLMLDPARRGSAGEKTVHMADCEPSVPALLPQLLAKARYVMVKLSPMLDISEALRELSPHVIEVHVVGASGECKDLLLVLGIEATANPHIVVMEGGTRFSFTLADESAAKVSYALEGPAAFLYEPGAAMMKAGAFRSIAQRLGVKKLHPNSHLYTSERLVPGFPGRSFRVERILGFSKRELGELRRNCPKANLAVRNFPAGVAELRKRLHLKEGGDVYIFATTTQKEEHVLIMTKKA